MVVVVITTTKLKVIAKSICSIINLGKQLRVPKDIAQTSLRTAIYVVMLELIATWVEWRRPAGRKKGKSVELVERWHRRGVAHITRVHLSVV